MKLKITILVLILISVSGFILGKRFLFDLDWELISSAKSPNGSFNIKYYRSKSEGGHAPYGDNLVIESWKSFPNPRQGETFFASYCDNSLSYKWVGNGKIVINCKPGNEPHRTQAITVHGIKVEVTEE